MIKALKLNNYTRLVVTKHRSKNSLLVSLVGRDSRIYASLTIWNNTNPLGPYGERFRRSLFKERIPREAESLKFSELDGGLQRAISVLYVKYKISPNTTYINE